MKWDKVTSIVALVALLFTIGGFVYARGAMDARLKVIEDKETVEGAQNTLEHGEFRSMERSVVGIGTKVEGLEKSLDEVRSDVKEVLKRLPR